MWDDCPCELCGRCPARPATFISIVSLLVAVQSTRVSGYFCRDCAVLAYEGRTKALLGLAWWGLGILAAPIFTLMNWAALARCRQLAAPADGAVGAAGGRIPAGNTAISPNAFLYAAPVVLWLPLGYILSIVLL